MRFSKVAAIAPLVFGALCCASAVSAAAPDRAAGIRHTIDWFGERQVWLEYPALRTNVRAGTQLLTDRYRSLTAGMIVEVCALKVAWRYAAGSPTITAPGGTPLQPNAVFGWDVNANAVLLYQQNHAQAGQAVSGQCPNSIRPSFAHTDEAIYATVNDIVNPGGDLADNYGYADNSGTFDLWVRVNPPARMKRRLLHR